MKILGKGSSNGSQQQHRLSSAIHVRRSVAINPTHVITLVICSITSFYCGTIIGWNVGWNACSSSSVNNGSSPGSNQNCNEVCKKIMVDNMKRTTLTEKSNTPKLNTSTEKSNTTPAGISKRFSHSLSHWATGLVSINRKDLFDTFDFGVPLDTNGAEREDVLMLYNEQEAMPSNTSLSHLAEYDGDIPHATATEATENCDTMNVVFINNPRELGNTQCVALVGGQVQGYHVQRWQRLITGEAHGSHAPLQLTSRLKTNRRVPQKTSEDPRHLEQHQEIMKTYFNSLTKIRNELDDILKKIAKNNSVVVMTVDSGQSDLLMNFVCSARARGFSLDNVILFPTDIFSRDLAEGLGLATYYSHDLMKYVPEQASQEYGSDKFGAVVIAKVLCIHLVNDLGYDLLFQDVDVVWYKNPLDFFHSAENSGYDVYFQDDGSRGVQFAPYAANSGFYFARSNDRSKRLFRSQFYVADRVLDFQCDQTLLATLLPEHNSLNGLRVKVLSRDNTVFLSGFHYNMKREYMKQMINGDNVPHIFHMSWTRNKIEKVAYMKQMGMWYVKDDCAGSLGDECCSAEPIIECSYKDKPSVVPCKDSPAKEKGAGSFW